MTAHVEVMDLVAQMKAAEQAFALATVVRTVSVTAAKAGAKAIIRPDGTIVAGWIGGGCARGAAAGDVLSEPDVGPGGIRDGANTASFAGFEFELSGSAEGIRSKAGDAIFAGDGVCER